ncbi:MAG: NosD domain-containing protein, partial [Candidatus Thorarchaeota archaeon]
SEIKMNQISDIYSEGIYFGNAMNSEISFNSIVDAEDAGIIGMGVNTCNMRNNTVSNITGVGISVDYCQQSDISMNDI